MVPLSPPIPGITQKPVRNVLETDQIAELHIRASHWFVENGLTDEAIQHALAAGDAVSAAEIIEQRRHIEHETGNWYRVEKWLAMLPDEIKEKRPGLILAQAWVAFIRFQLDQIPPMIAQIEMLLNDQDADVGLLGELTSFTAISLIGRVRPKLVSVILKRP